MKLTKFFVSVLLITFAATGCTTDKEPIRYGTDVCDHCKMLAMDPKFGAEIITAKGKIYKFDDINCMIIFINNPSTNPGEIAQTFVIDYSHPQTLISAKEAFYVQSDFIKSPMASGVAAFATNKSRYENQQKWQGKEFNWAEINSKFK